ncbi:MULTISPECIES: pRL2-8 [Streptomyces]|uniref:pRL2-8 n=1 Tax=Streptomyces TaxID=1883 RepID=UPI00226D687F|nr:MULTISPECIES: pRL2-8 [unclassified Streptomyces]MCY0923709.1 pRL2-8 [Streptomyces sp. H27-G5]MCY0947736.1 pRL2-8 [Streptomyces sp. H34-AA3]MCZ4088476.1 pRL2-8 [Streptomyces sp. H34-S5]MDJ0466991.1 pRL2-8 [Streptomyces sp. H27-C3]
MPSHKALNPPKRQCRQCWLHAYDSRAVHRHLAPRQDCPECVDHMLKGCPDHMIVR